MGFLRLPSSRTKTWMKCIKDIWFPLQQTSSKLPVIRENPGKLDKRWKKHFLISRTLLSSGKMDAQADIQLGHDKYNRGQCVTGEWREVSYKPWEPRSLDHSCFPLFSLSSPISNVGVFPRKSPSSQAGLPWPQFFCSQSHSSQREPISPLKSLQWLSIMP